MDGTKEHPVTGTAKFGSLTINFTSPHVRINTGTKIYTMIKNVFIGGAGEYEKIQNYINNIKNSNVDTIINDTINYYDQNKINAPDQLLLMKKKKEICTISAFYHEQNPSTPELYGYHNCQFILNDENIGVLAIGSGGPLLLQMYLSIKEKTLDEYKEALKNNTYDKWEIKFIEKIKCMYSDISKYNNGVSEDIEMYTM
jgi:hypothetical protein